MKTRLATIALAAFALLCGTVLGSVALATHRASWHDIATGGASLVGSLVVLVMVVVFFTVD